MSRNALIVDPELRTREMLIPVLKSEGFEIVTAGTAAEALRLINAGKFTLVVSELQLEADDSGFTLAYHFKQREPKGFFLILTALPRNRGIAFSLTDPGAAEWIHADAILNKEARPEQILREIRRIPLK